MDTPEPSESPWPILPLFGLAGLAAVVGGLFMLFAGPKQAYVPAEQPAATAGLQPPPVPGQGEPAAPGQPSPRPEPTAPPPS
jgi:hypothetical protein